MKQERRFLNQEIVIEGSTESPKIAGYASVFSKKSHDLGNFREVVDPKAFDSCLSKNPHVLALFNHSNDMVLGSTSSGTLRLSVDEVGLKYEVDPPNTTYANDLLVSMKRQDIRDASFGFYARKDSWHVDKQTNENIRTILEADVFDVSVCSAGAYPDASSQVRALFPEDKGNIPESITSNIAELRNAQRKEKRGRNILASVSSSKWAILPEKLETICAFLTGWSEGKVASKDEIQAAMMGQDSVYEAEQSNGVAVIPVYGVINQRMTMMAEFCGGTSTDKLTAQLRAAVADASVTAVVLDIDSPGGTVTGVPELAAEIMKLKADKPIIAVANGMAASAAYWIAAACSSVVVTPSGEVGSIGVYMTHQDVSAAMDKAGVKIQFIQAGKYKTDGNPYEPASESFLADAQAGVDEYYEMFTQGVADGRGVSQEVVKSPTFGQGRMLMAKDAVANGLADSIQTLDQVVAGLLGAEVKAGSVEETVDQSSDNGIEISAVVPKANDAAGCMCECPECLAGSHAECTGGDGDCDFDDMGGGGVDDDNDASYVLAAKSVRFIELTPEEVEAEKLTGERTMRYSKVFGPDAKGVTRTESVTKEEFNTLLDASAVSAPVVAEEIAPEPLSAEAQHEADENTRIAYKVKLMNLY